MENKEKKYKRVVSNKPIYTYKPISYYSNQSEDDNRGGDEEEFSYRMNTPKLKALKEKKIKKERKMNKTFEKPNNLIPKSEMPEQNLKETQKKEESLPRLEKVKKKKSYN